MNSKMFHEIIAEFETAETRAERIEVLRKNADNTFKDFLIAAFNPTIEFDVDIPEYQSSLDPAGLNILYLHQEVPRLYRFIKGHPRRAAGLTGKKQTELLIGLLESLHSLEAELLVRCIKKDLRVPFLTPKIVKEAFPDINIGV